MRRTLGVNRGVVLVLGGGTMSEGRTMSGASDTECSRPSLSRRETWRDLRRPRWETVRTAARTARAPRPSSPSGASSSTTVNRTPSIVRRWSDT